MQEALDRLKLLENELRDVDPSRWTQVEVWGDKALPTIMKHCSEHIERFNNLLKKPAYPAVGAMVGVRRPEQGGGRYIFSPEKYAVDHANWAAHKRRNEQQSRNVAAAYNQNCKTAHERIIAFLDGLIYEMNSPQSTSSIRISGNTTGSTIVAGDGNSINTQVSQHPSDSETRPKRKLLILAANPKNSARLRLDEEVRDISDGLHRSRHRDDFEMIQRWAVRPRDFQRAMLEECPQLVHFSGHGDGEEGLYFEDAAGHPKPVPGKALASLFKLFSQKTQIECVVLNGCYSQAQAAEIVAHVPYVVGMKQAVGDQAAIEFAVGFYEALGNGEPIEFAFKCGKVAMELNSTGYAEMPLLLSRSVDE